MSEAATLTDVVKRVTTLVEHYNRDAPFRAPETVSEWQARLLNNVWLVLTENADMDVVPCNDDAVERAAKVLYDSSDERVRVDGVEWENEPDGYRMLWREKARAVFTAARSTND